MNLTEYRRKLALELVAVLEANFTKHVGDWEQWWNSHVVEQLSYGQRGQVRSRGIERLGQLDLHALLRVFDRNWGELSHWCRLGNEVRTYLKGIADQRNEYSHEAAERAEVAPADLYRDVDTLLRCSSALNLSADFQRELTEARTEALEILAASTLPSRILAQSEVPCEPAPTLLEPPERSKPTLEPKPALEEPQKDPAARALGSFRLHGPGESFASEIQSFRGNPVPATEIPWRVTGPGGLELKVHICLIDDPEEEDEIGQVFCDSRLGSPQQWDEIVGRLRTGIRRLDDSRLYMDLRAAQSKDGNRATRRVIPLEALPKIAGLDVATELQRLNSCEIGTRAQLTGSTNKTKAWPCMVFDSDDILTPVAAWVAVTVAPLISIT
jgi:hypothetical protein